MPKYRVITAPEATQISIWAYDIDAGSEAEAIEKARAGDYGTDDGPKLVRERHGEVDFTDVRGFSIDHGDESRAINEAIATFEEECE